MHTQLHNVVHTFQKMECIYLYSLSPCVGAVRVRRDVRVSVISQSQSIPALFPGNLCSCSHIKM